MIVTDNGNTEFKNGTDKKKEGFNVSIFLSKRKETSFDAWWPQQTD